MAMIKSNIFFLEKRLELGTVYRYCSNEGWRQLGTEMAD